MAPEAQVTLATPVIDINPLASHPPSGQLDIARRPLSQILPGIAGISAGTGGGGAGTESRPSGPDQLNLLLEMVREMRQSSTLPSQKTKKWPWNWKPKTAASILPKWAPKHKLLKRLSSSEEEEEAQGGPVKEFTARFEKLALDMKEVAELGKHPDVREQCGFEMDVVCTGWMNWCMINISWLDEEGGLDSKGRPEMDRMGSSSTDETK